MNMGWVSDKWYEFDIMQLKLSWGLYCQEEQIYQSALLLAYLKGQCPGEANKGSGCLCCYGGHSQSRVCDHKAEPTHFQMTVQENIMSQVCEWKCLSHKWGLQARNARMQSGTHQAVWQSCWMVPQSGALLCHLLLVGRTDCKRFWFDLRTHHHKAPIQLPHHIPVNTPNEA